MATHTHTRTETLEERFVRLLDEAIEAGKKIQLARSTEDRPPGLGEGSRSNALAITNAEQGLLWAQKDLIDKNEQEAKTANPLPTD